MKRSGFLFIFPRQCWSTQLGKGLESLNGFSIHFETLTPLAGNIAFDIWVKLKDTNYILIYDFVIIVF